MDPRYHFIPYPDFSSPVEAAATIFATTTNTEASASVSSRHGGAPTAKRTKPAATWPRISAAIIESLRDLHYVLSLEGAIQQVSLNSTALLGYGPEELAGTLLVDHVHEDDAPLYRDELREASSTGRPFRFYCRFRSRVNVVGAGTNAGTVLLRPKFAEQDPTIPPSFSVFEITGRFHEVVPHGPIAVGIGVTATLPSDNGLFVLMARPYPLAQATKLDSFLALKIENERLTAQLATLKAEQEENDHDADPEDYGGYHTRQYFSMAAPPSTFTTAAMRRSSDGFPWFDVPPANITLTTGSASSAQESIFSSGSGSSMFGPASSSSTNTSTSIIGPPPPHPPSSCASTSSSRTIAKKPSPVNPLPRTFSTTAVPGIVTATTRRSSNSNISNRSPPTNTPTVMEGDVGIPFIVKALTGSAGFKKRAKLTTDDYVCSWCSSTTSPEWRKGPSGPKSLCNACGLRYAKSRRKNSSQGGRGGDGDSRAGSSSSSRIGPATGPDAKGGGASEATTVGPVTAGL